MLEKQISFKHGVSELGNLQTYQVVKIVEDGKVKGEKTSQPYTPKDVNDMEGFDPRSKEIVAAIITSEAKADFIAEKQEPTGVGLEEIVTYDRMVNELTSVIEIRRIIRIFDDGIEISKKFYRDWIIPGVGYTGKAHREADTISKALAQKLHTPEVIAAYEASQNRE